jgi:hypothetical protein
MQKKTKNAIPQNEKRNPSSSQHATLPGKYTFSFSAKGYGYGLDFIGYRRVSITIMIIQITRLSRI